MLFDLDHTLLDSDASERLAFEATARSVGIEEPHRHLVAYQALNRALWKKVERGELSPNEVKTKRFEELVSMIDVDVDPVAMGEKYVNDLGAHGELYPGAIDVLEAVVETSQLALITNGIGAVQRARIERLGIGGFFSAIAISGELGMAKPDPAIFEHVFDMLGHTRDRSAGGDRGAIIVGDSLSSDILGGHNAGIATCWFNRLNEPSGPIEPTMEVTALTQVAPALLG